MSVRDWHPGKIGLMWAGYLLLFLAMVPTAGSDAMPAAMIWFVLAIPAFVITWKWLSGREKKE